MSSNPQVYHTHAPTQAVRTVGPTTYRTANDSTIFAPTSVNTSNVVRRSEGVFLNSAPTTQTYVTNAPTTQTYVTNAPTTQTYVTRAPTQSYVGPATTTQTYVTRAPTTQTYVTAAPVHRVIQSSPVRETVVRSAPIARTPQVTVNSSSNLNNSVIKIDDEARYKYNAEEQHGFGRANTKSRFGTQSRSFNNRHNVDLRDPIISTKKTAPEYRNDNDCNMI